MRINAAKAMELLSAQVAKKGELHVYTRRNWAALALAGILPAGVCDHASSVCVNWIPVGEFRQADCIMGYVYEDLGVLYSVPASVNIHGARFYLYQAGVLLTDRAVRVFFAAQKVQDMGGHWGYAVDIAATYADSSLHNDTEYRPWPRQAF